MCALSALAPRNRPLLFADLCGGPGGFSEYLMRCRGAVGGSGGGARGWGMTLRGSGGCEWDERALSPFIASGSLRLAGGEGGDGDITRVQNIVWLARTVARESTAASSRDGGSDSGSGTGGGSGSGSGAAGRGGSTAAAFVSKSDPSSLPLTQGALDLVVADGGTDAARDLRAAEQERAMEALAGAQACAALLLLRRGGTFVLKLLGAATEPTATLLDVLALLFDQLAVVKPVASRPASSERYIVCRGFVARAVAAGRRLRCAAALLADLQARAAGGRGDFRVALSACRDCGGAGASGSQLRQWRAFLRRANDALAVAQIGACNAIVAEAMRDEGDGRGKESREGGGGGGGARVRAEPYWEAWGFSEWVS
eukprot:g4336.t1